MKKLWVYKSLMIFIFIVTIIDFNCPTESLSKRIDMSVTGLLIIYALYLIMIYIEGETLEGFRPNQLGTGMILGVLIGFGICICCDVNGNEGTIVSFCMLLGTHIGFRNTIFKHE